MFGLGLPELVLILVIGLIFFGPANCPISARLLVKVCVSSSRP